MMEPHVRVAVLQFLTDHASDDILIAAANRASNNIEDAKALMKYIAGMPKAAPPEPTKFEDVKRAVVPVDRENSVPNLGEPASKLGKNGQDILAFINKHARVKEIRLEEICSALKLPESKVKPMLGLLLQRKQIIMNEWGGFLGKVEV